MPPTTIPQASPSRLPVEPWLSKADIAAHYRVSARTVERWMFAGCPSRLLGGVRRFLFSEVDAWLSRREEEQ